MLLRWLLMTKKLGAAAAFLLAVVVGVVFMSRPPVAPIQVTEDCVEGVLDPRVPVVGKVCGEPTPAPDEPLTPTKPPDPPQKFPIQWGTCAEIASSRQRAEDAWLREVLASTVQDSPLFGVATWSMEAAECAARRWRLAGL